MIFMDKQNLINKIYKLLPIYEGKLMKNEEFIPKKVAYKNFQRNLDLAIIEFNGISMLCEKSKTIDSIKLILYGLKEIGLDQNTNVKNAIFKCIRYINKLEF